MHVTRHLHNSIKLYSFTIQLYSFTSQLHIFTAFTLYSFTAIQLHDYTTSTLYLQVVARRHVPHPAPTQYYTAIHLYSYSTNQLYNYTTELTHYCLNLQVVVRLDVHNAALLNTIQLHSCTAVHAVHHNASARLQRCYTARLLFSAPAGCRLSQRPTRGRCGQRTQ